MLQTVSATQDKQVLSKTKQILFKLNLQQRLYNTTMVYRIAQQA